MLPAAAETTPGHEDDVAILTRIAAGDMRAFEYLMRRYNRRLFRVARSILRDDAEAEDALQDAYLQAYRGLPAFRGESSTATWLTRIVMNAALMRRRKNVRMAEIIELHVDPAMDDHSAPSDQPEHAVLRAQARRLIETKIDGLPDVFRTVFVLRALEELNVEETAEALGIPEATVRSRFFRARSMLREGLARDIDVAFEDAFSFDGARCDRIVREVLRRAGDEEKP
jgi:RNA polymerase sigma-70 factor (ECF subfamily)